MRARSTFAPMKPLVRDTFRQAWASGISGILLVATAICVVLCLSVDVSGDVALHGGDEPVLFLPPPSPRATAPSPAGPKGGSPLEFDPAFARREGIEVVGGRMTLAFGAVSIPVSRERSDAVSFLELILAGGVAGTFG